jgi:hypothetical protein
MRKLKDEKRLQWELNQFHKERNPRNGSLPTLESRLGNSENFTLNSSYATSSKTKNGQTQKIYTLYWEDIADAIN